MTINSVIRAYVWLRRRLLQTSMRSGGVSGEALKAEKLMLRTNIAGLLL